MRHINVFELFGSVVLKDEVSKPLDDIEKKAEKTEGKLSRLSEGVNNFGQGAQKFGGTLTKTVTLPILAAGGAIMGMTTKLAGTGDQIHKHSQKMGVSYKAYQELDYWAGQNGLSQSDMEKAVGRLNQRIGEAREGNEKYTNAMKEMGINMRALEEGHLSTEQALRMTLQGLSEMTNEQDKAALAGELFGTKLAQELLPALNDGSLSIEDAAKQAEELGFVLSDDAVESAAAFEDSMDDLKREVEGFVRQLGEKVLPVIVDKVIPAIKDHLLPILEKITDKIGIAIDWFSNLDPEMKKTIGIILAIVVALGPAIAIFGKLVSIFSVVINVFSSVGGALSFLAGPIGIVIAIIGVLIGIGVLLYKNWDTVKEKASEIFAAIGEFFVGVGEWFKSLFESIKDFFVGVWEAIKGFFQSVWEFIKETFEAIKNAILTPIIFIKETITKIIEGIKNFFVNTFEAIRVNTVEKFEAIKNAILAPIEWAKEKISNIVEAIKGFFTNMKLKIPKIKLPKLPKPKITGKFSLSPISVPKLSWNKEGGIFDTPTIFDTNKGFQGVGEAGAEAIIPIEKLKGWIEEWSNKKDLGLSSSLNKLSGAISGLSYQKQPALATSTPTPQNININFHGDWTVDSKERQESLVDELSKEVDKYFRSRGDR